MGSASILRAIRAHRIKKFEAEKEFLSGMWTLEQFKQLLIVDPPCQLDIVSLMNVWVENRSKEMEKKNTLFSDVQNRWVRAGKDPEEQKNRQNGIQSLIHKKILQKAFDNKQEMTICQFVQCNPESSIIKRILISTGLSELTKKTYKNMYRSFLKYALRYIYGPTTILKRRFKALKRGIRPLELSEAARLFDALEMKALKSKVAMRDLLILRLMMYSGEGIEIKGIFSLKRSDISFVDNTITVSCRRHSAFIAKERVVKCSLDFMQLLKSYLGKRRKAIFEGENKLMQDHINKRLSRLSRELEIFDVTPKSLQRSLKDILKRNGVV